MAHISYKFINHISTRW